MDSVVSTKTTSIQEGIFNLFNYCGDAYDFGRDFYIRQQFADTKIKLLWFPNDVDFFNSI